MFALGGGGYDPAGNGDLNNWPLSCSYHSLSVPCLSPFSFPCVQVGLSDWLEERLDAFKKGPAQAPFIPQTRNQPVLSMLRFLAFVNSGNCVKCCVWQIIFLFEYLETDRKSVV